MISNDVQSEDRVNNRVEMCSLSSAKIIKIYENKLMRNFIKENKIIK